MSTVPFTPLMGEFDGSSQTPANALYIQCMNGSICRFQCQPAYEDAYIIRCSMMACKSVSISSEGEAMLRIVTPIQLFILIQDRSNQLGYSGDACAARQLWAAQTSRVAPVLRPMKVPEQTPACSFCVKGGCHLLQVQSPDHPLLLQYSLLPAHQGVLSLARARETGANKFWCGRHLDCSLL